MSLVELHKKLNEHTFPLEEHQRLHEIACLCKNCPFFGLFDPLTPNDKGGLCSKFEDFREADDFCLRILTVDDCVDQYETYTMLAKMQIQTLYQTLNFEGVIRDLQVARHYLGMMTRPRILRYYTFVEESEE